jgi:hypothetical protein
MNPAPPVIRMFFGVYWSSTRVLSTASRMKQIQALSLCSITCVANNLKVPAVDTIDDIVQSDGS